MGKFSQGSPANRKQEDLLACSQACLRIHISDIFYLLHRSTAVLLDLIKDQRFNKKNLKTISISSPNFFSPTIPPVTNLSLVRQSL
jgi:hypothetical protein